MIARLTSMKLGWNNIPRSVGLFRPNGMDVNRAGRQIGNLQTGKLVFMSVRRF